MGSLYLYSTNPWYAHELSQKHLGGKCLVWCSDNYDPTAAAALSAAALTAPSSSPKGIYDILYSDCEHEEKNSGLIKKYKKTFKKLALSWHMQGIITPQDKDEILATINSHTWNIWKPLLYIIYRPPIESAGRLIQVNIGARAAYGNEWKIADLDKSEFEILRR